MYVNLYYSVLFACHNHSIVFCVVVSGADRINYHLIIVIMIQEISSLSLRHLSPASAVIVVAAVVVVTYHHQLLLHIISAVVIVIVLTCCNCCLLSLLSSSTLLLLLSLPSSLINVWFFFAQWFCCCCMAATYICVYIHHPTIQHVSWTKWIIKMDTPKIHKKGKWRKKINICTFFLFDKFSIICI